MGPLTPAAWSDTWSSDSHASETLAESMCVAPTASTCYLTKQKVEYDDLLTKEDGGGTRLGASGERDSTNATTLVKGDELVKVVEIGEHLILKRNVKLMPTPREQETQPS
jgi:hypothetical protein